MNGLELSRRYWLEVGRPAFETLCPEVLRYAAVGLAGEGSECFGYDDEISRDHDWGPGFCVWLPQTAFERFGTSARQIYTALPQEFLGLRRLRENAMSAGRVGIHEIGAFYQHFLGLNQPPNTVEAWRSMPEAGLSAVTNGVIFQDSSGEFTTFRRALLNYYPEDIRRKKLAAQCALAAQSGQYNYSRCLRRGETVAAMSALAQFIDHAQSIVFLLNRVYRPYYKWSHRRLRELPILGGEAAVLMETLVQGGTEKETEIEALSALIASELKQQKLSEADDDFLLTHAAQIQQKITDPALRSLHLMAE